MDEITLSGWRDRLDALAGGRRETVTIVGVVLALVLAGLLLAARDAPAQIAPPATVPGDPAAATTGRAVGAVFVHVAGAVKAPGLYELPQGSRVADALARAGGVTRRADLEALNLAQLLLDGAKVDVPRRGELSPTVPAAEPASPGAPAPVSLNHADQVALEAVPGLGPVKAAAIVRYREESGPFTALEQVMEVSGIGPATFASIRPFISL